MNAWINILIFYFTKMFQKRTSGYQKQRIKVFINQLFIKSQRHRIFINYKMENAFLESSTGHQFSKVIKFNITDYKTI